MLTSPCPQNSVRWPRGWMHWRRFRRTAPPDLKEEQKAWFWFIAEVTVPGSSPFASRFLVAKPWVQEESSTLQSSFLLAGLGAGGRFFFGLRWAGVLGSSLLFPSGSNIPTSPRLSFPAVKITAGKINLQQVSSVKERQKWKQNLASPSCKPTYLRLSWGPFSIQASFTLFNAKLMQVYRYMCLRTTTWFICLAQNWLSYWTKLAKMSYSQNIWLF